MRRWLIAHPLLIAAFPSLFLWSHNLQSVPGSFIPIPLLTSLAATVVIWAILTLCMRRDAQRSAMVVSAIVILFFSFNGIVDWLLTLELASRTTAETIVLIFITVLPIVVAYLVQRTKDVQAWTSRLNLIAAILVGMPLFNIVTGLARSVHPEASSSYASTAASRPSLAGGAFGQFEVAAPATRPSSNQKIDHPDIYFIVLDAHARTDMLKEIYGVDNSAFIKSLRLRGFYVPTHNTSNYYRTVQSLTATLNCCYLSDMKLDAFTEGTDPRQLLGHSLVVNTLRGMGYRFVAYGSGVWQTELTDADDYRSLGPPPAPFTYMLLDNTPIRLLTKLQPTWSFDQIHRREIRYILDNLPSVADDTRPTFTFAHIVCPHPPFVFGANGESVPLPQGYDGSADGSDYYRRHYGTVAEYRHGYGNQAKYIDGQISLAIDRILEKSKAKGGDPIIIVMSDHGPRSSVSFDDFGATNFREALSNFMAVRMPRGSEVLYDDMSPVNLFRIIFTEQFDLPMDRVPDRCLYAVKSSSVYTDVTDRVKGTHARSQTASASEAHRAATAAGDADPSAVNSAETKASD